MSSVDKSCREVWYLRGKVGKQQNVLSTYSVPSILLNDEQTLCLLVIVVTL